MIRQIEPARCKHKFSFEEAASWIEDEKHVYEIKEDGRRYLLHTGAFKNALNFLTSRGISKKTGRFVEQQDTVPFMRDFKFSRILRDTVFDGEIVGGNCRTDVITQMKRGKVEYHVWDILFHQGRDVRGQSYKARRMLLRASLWHFPEWMTLVRRWHNPQFVMKMVKQYKLEGMVRKLVEGTYGEGWDKVKRADTWDVVIMGYEPSNSVDFIQRGWIGSIIFGQYADGELCEIGRTSGFTKAFRAQISQKQKEYLGRVIEVKAQEQLKSGALAHPRFVRVRGVEEKRPEECIFIEK